MARIVRMLGVLVLALAALAAAVEGPGLGARADGTAAAQGTTPEIPASASTNESAARADAAWLLTTLSLPAGATPSAVEPAGDGGLLARAAQGAPATPNVVDDHTWWVVPGTSAAVLAYVTSHPPAGSSRAFFSTAGMHGVTDLESEGFAWAPVDGVLSTRWLVVAVAGLADGSTAVRADSQVVWLTPRPASEQIPSGSHLVRISVHSSIKSSQPRQRPLTVGSSRRVDRVVALLNSLPVAQPGLRSCPADFGIVVRLAFAVRASARPLAVAEVDPAGCGLVQLTIGGRREPPLEAAPTPSGSTLIDQIESALAVKLKVTPPRAR